MPAEMLTDQAIEEALRTAFAPHRCDVQIQLDAFTQARKLALVIHAAGLRATEREFIVEGIGLDTLRRREALLDYIDDVRGQLKLRRIGFATSVRFLRDPR
jgi:hypothetical protein